MNCPYWGSGRQLEPQTEFGLRNLIDYEIGDSIQWGLGKAIHNGGRQKSGTTTTEASIPEPLTSYPWGQ